MDVDVDVGVDVVVDGDGDVPLDELEPTWAPAGFSIADGTPW